MTHEPPTSVPVRICSLVPAATEVLFALGLGDAVAGVTHECDWPPEAGARPAVTSSIVDGSRLRGAEIDRLVSAAAKAGRPLYAVDGERWDEIDADVIVAQDICDVCAVSAGDVRALGVEVVGYSPTTLDGIGTAILTLGARFGAEAAAAGIVDRMAERIRRVPAPRASPRVFVAEWLDPPFAAGHWVPEMVRRAGGREVLGVAGKPSFRTTWDAVGALAPDLVVLAPCGFDEERTLAELEGVPGLPDCPSVAVDANAFFSRPGPRVAQGVEILGELFRALGDGAPARP